MKKVYQTIVDKGNGNCLQATIASLFDEELDDVPHFISYGEQWWDELCKYLNSKGYEVKDYLYSPIFWGGDDGNIVDEFHLDRLQEYEGVNGLFWASVSSPKYNPDGELSGTTHAVLVDKNFNIVHDPNLDYANIQYPRHDEKYKGVRQVFLIEKN